MELYYLLESLFYSYFGVGLSFIVAIFFTVHVLKTGRHLAWILALFFVPFMLGSIAYFFIEFIKNPRFASGGGASVSQSAFKFLNPREQLKKTAHEYEIAPSVNNAIAYAKALSATNKPDEAVAIFEKNMTGMWETDVDYLESMCYALIDANQGTRALEIAQKIRQLNPQHKPQTVALLHGLSYGLLGQQAQAQAEFEVSVRTSDIFALSQYTIWAANTGKPELATQLRARMEESWKVWSPQHQRMHRETFKQVDKSIKKMGKA